VAALHADRGQLWSLGQEALEKIEITAVDGQGQFDRERVEMGQAQHGR
jgi:hypothetical protein